MRKSKNLWKWILSTFFFLSALAFLPSVSSIFLFLLTLLILPVAPIERVIQSILKPKWLRIVVIAALVFVSLLTAPSNADTSIDEPIAETQLSVTDPSSYIPPVTHNPTEQTERLPTDEETLPAFSQIENTESPSITPTTPSVPQNSSLEVHFIDVGQADAALVLCDGYSMLIDGGNVGDSSKLFSYLKKHNISHLDYVIGTHAHEDHIGGIAGALNFATAGTAYCPVDSYDTDAFSNFKRALQKHNVPITIPTVGENFLLGSASCEIIAINTQSDVNNSSIVLRIKYGETSFLFTGDAEREVEQEILSKEDDLLTTVLKVGHHGSETSTSYVWLRELMPEYAVISVGTDNTYGHPTEEVLSRLRDAEIKTFRTDLQGDILCVSDGKSVTFSVSKNEDIDVFGGIGENSTQKEDNAEKEPSTEEETQQQGTHYILNTKSKKFHEASCGSAAKISPTNRKDFYGTREELIAIGYSPCGNCDP